MITGRQFSFGGRSCREFGVVCSGSGTFGAPERDAEVVEVPGRNGSLVIDKGRYKDIQVVYPCFISRDFQRNMAAFRAWLLSMHGYQRLEDGYNPESFRMGMVTGGVSADPAPLNRGATFDVAFLCKPQRWLYIGEEEIAVSSGQELTNPTPFPAEPLITVQGSGAGVLTVGDTSVSILSMPDGVLTLDCAEQNAYGSGGANRNNTISAPEFPRLAAGETVIRWTGDITGVKIVPRWWTI